MCFPFLVLPGQIEAIANVDTINNHESRHALRAEDLRREKQRKEEASEEARIKGLALLKEGDRKGAIILFGQALGSWPENRSVQ